MSPTFSVAARAIHEYAKLSAQDRKQFAFARRTFVDALRSNPSSLPPRLRIKRVQGHEGVWELTWAPDGRATFDYGSELIPGEPHIRWRRIGNHSIFVDP